ncbi:MAG: hypothetical protein H7332_05210 [Bdellovibrionales bacterium]|nr:hypothetical protein [Ramlibacter sp.]
MVHDFDRDFRFSESDDAHALVRRACHRLVVDCIGVTRANANDDRRGVDYWVATSRGRFGLDLKPRRKDYSAQRGGPIDCVLELDSHGTSGWLLKAGGAQLILFANIDTHRVAMFEAKKLRTAVMLNLSRWLANGLAKELTTHSTRGGSQWTSRAVIVAADLLASAIDRIEEGDAASNDGVQP